MSRPPIIIAGVGRSGTTAAFELIHGWLKNLEQLGTPVYEPYIWDSKALFRGDELNPDGFTTQAFSARGVLTHLETALFLTEPDAAHDQFVESLVPEGDGLIKMIRGCGRLEAYSRLYPDAKIIGVVRNPFDSVNSAHLHFSLLGDEFHRSDKLRLAEEIERRFGDKADLPASPDEKEHVWAGYWWLYMNRALTEHYAAHPQNVMLLPYELLLENEAVARDRLAGFLGLAPLAAPEVTQGRKRTGVTTKANRVLSEAEIGFLTDFQNWYEEFLLDPLETEGLISDRYKLGGLQDFYEKSTGHSLLRKYPTWRTSVGWRFAFDGRTGHKKQDAETRASEAQAQLENALKSLARPSRNDDAQISCIVSIHNEPLETIERALGCLLTQSLRPTEIILADDASDEAVSTHCRRLAESHFNVRHLRQPNNVGPGANRHLATLQARQNWVAHMDTDDFWWPDKLESEWAALQGADDPLSAVAMSDVEVYEDGDYDHSWVMEELAALPGYRQVGYLFRRDGPVPRDMLMTKALYRAAGGFETYGRMYEDWVFKLRLTRVASAWVATGRSGVSYYRERDLGLSSGDAMKHLYWRWFALCRNAAIEPDYEPLLRDGFWMAAELLPAHEWLRKLLHIALARAVKSGDPQPALRRAAQGFLARARLDRPEGHFAGELERFAQDLMGMERGQNRTRKLKLVRTR